MDAYKIGVSIVLANGVSSVLAVIGKDLLGLKTSVGEIEGKMGLWKGALIGVGAVLAGTTILGTMAKLVEMSADFQDAMTKVAQLNPKTAALVESGEIKKLSFGLATKLGMKVEDVANIYGGVFGVLQDPEEAEKITPYAARYARLMEMRHPGSHPEESINTLMRAGELSGRLSTNGAIDPEKVKKWFDTVAQLQAATHGQVDAQSLLGLAQQAGGGAMRGLTEEGFDHMAILSQMMGGQRAGTALLSLRGQMTGAMMKRNAEAMLDYGVLRPGEATSEGGHVSLTPEATSRLLGMLNKDPVKFVDYLVKTLEAQGITDQEQQIEAISRMVGRQTSNREIQDILLSRQQMERETTGLKQGATVDEGLKGYEGNIHAAEQNVDSAWHNLAVAIGGPEGERFAFMLNKIAGAVNWLTGVVNNLDPDTINTAFEVVAGFAVGLMTIGGIILTALAITVIGPLVGGAVLLGGVIAGVVAAVGTFIYLKWDSISKAFHGIGDSISEFIDWVASLYNRARHLLGLDSKDDFVATQGPGVDKAPAGQSLGGAHHHHTSPSTANKLKNPTIFTPDTEKPKPQPVSFSLNVDGRTLAQTVSAQLAELMMFPTGAGAPDHWGQWADADSNLSTT